MNEERNTTQYSYESQPYTQQSPIYNGGAGGPEVTQAENYALGILGAFLFSLGGVFVYIVLYQLNIIAGISGFLMFVLAQLGYGLFTKTNKRVTIAGMITAVVMMLIMIPVAEYFSIAYVVFAEVKDYGFTLADSIALVPEVFKEPGMPAAAAKELLMAYAFGVFAIAGYVATFIKQRKAEKNAQKVQINSDLEN